MTKMKKQPNKRNKQKKTYKEIEMEKQVNTCKIEKKKTIKGKIGKANYEDNDNREKADRVLVDRKPTRKVALKAHHARGGGGREKSLVVDDGRQSECEGDWRRT
jgi:hypothetical protein